MEIGMTPTPHPLSREGHILRLQRTKPTQEEMDTAARVCRWLADHAHFWPEEWATDGDPDATEASAHLNWAADQCDGASEDLITSLDEQVERDACNRNAALRGASEAVPHEEDQ
jgi:hypothetical protein